MAMEFQEAELTIDDILQMHRRWITNLFVDENRSEVEIVQMLHDRHFTVTVSQIHQCLLDWDVRRPPPSLFNSSTSSSCIDIESWERLTPSSSMSSLVELYNNRPLPSLPSIPKMFKHTKYPSGKAYDKQRLELTYAPLTPSSTSPRTNPLENYVLDDQAHERMAMGLDRVPRRFTVSHDPSSQPRQSSHPRARKGKKDRKDDDSNRHPKRQ